MDENYFGITDTGKLRTNNEDTFIAETVDKGNLVLACVIDGVGGYSGGEIAAELARKSIMDHFKNTVSDKNKTDFLRQALVSANDAVYNERQNNLQNNQMACVVTLVIADINNNKIFYAHVGDTRLYLYRDNTLVKISHDHSFVGFLEDSGRLTEAEAMNHAKRNEINKALGFDGTISAEEYIETGESPFLPGDTIMLCSDGLSDMIDRNAITSILNNSVGLAAKGRLLIEAANAAGGKDNVTVVLVKNDKSAIKHTATKPSAPSAKNDLSKDESITTEYRAAETFPQPKHSKGSGAVPVLSTLLVLLVVACAWLFYQYWQNKQQAQSMPVLQADTTVKRSERELRLTDSLNNPLTKEIFIINTAGDQPFVLNDSLVLNNDSIHIIGNGVVFSGNGIYKGPAFSITSNTKYVLLDSMVLQDFDTAILLQSNALHFNKVIFRNCSVPVRSVFNFTGEQSLSGHVMNSLVSATGFNFLQIKSIGRLKFFMMVRRTERFFLLVISILFAAFFYQLYVQWQKRFDDVPARLANGTIMNLNAANPGQHIRVLLAKGFYFKDEKDPAYISGVIEKGLAQNDGEIDNIGELNKNKYSVLAEDAYNRGGQNFKKRIEISRTLLGFSDEDSLLYNNELKRPMNVPSDNNLLMGNKTISGYIESKAAQPAEGVLVRLRLVLPPDSVYSTTVTEVDKIRIENKNGIRKEFAIDTAGNKQLQSLSAYARTNASGNFSFSGLSANKAYEVLPLQPGYQFGRSKGIMNLEDNVAFNFIQAPHTIRLFSTRDFSNLRKEKSFIVRTPAEAGLWYWIVFGGFIAAFIVLHLLLSIRFPAADQLLLPIIMIFAGLSLLTLLSLQDALRDRFLSKSTFYYFLGGIGSMLVMLMFNLRYFTTDSLFYRLFIFKGVRKAANGWPWAVAAMGLLLLTILFGTGPEGSGVKVNLLGFQPSEIVKFLVIIFLAGFFAVNEKFISEYASFSKRLRFFLLALVAVVGTILLFLLLGDLGPAMVCCFTFIVLFSFSRGDFAQMIASIVLYVVAIWSTQNIWIGTAITIAVLLAYMLIKKQRLSESVVMALVVISSFMLLDKVPYLSKLFPGPVQRLIDRKAIWQDPWNNEVFGGDQVANGIWAMAGGGISGQGVGEGFAKTIPEAHTDMILPAIGEEFGWAGIISIFILFLLYLHRSIVIGRQTGRPFLFYLSSGIGIGTFIQFVLIAGGSTGALPLSGVALPFISYGGSSLITNMVAAGFLLSASHIQGTPAQMKFVTAQHDKNLLPALIAACIGIVLLGVNVSKYLFNNKKWVVEPALVADRNGSRMFSYNPRLNILMARLQAGNLLDRKGRLLATSDPVNIQQQQDSLLTAGLAKNDLDNIIHNRADRYYPFNEQMFFWTGDANTGVFNGSVNGYFAEYEHAAELRGFPTPSTKFTVSANRYKADKYLPQTSTEMTVSKRDYSALAPLLLAGINSLEVENFKKRNRDVQLTMDAGLQTNLQQALATDDSVKIKRVSVVIMEDDTGDVLASAMYPLPPVNDWDMLTLSENELNKFPGWNVNSDMGFTHATQPGSTAKLVTAMAAFNKLGEKAATKKILVHPQDLIRTKGLEPDEAGYIDIERGIVKSNNSFFIRLANEERLQEEMGTLYLQSGMFLHGVGGYYYQREPGNNTQENKWRELWRNTEFKSLRSYNPNNIRRTRGKGVSGMAWGQGELIATPAAVARIASGIANHGLLVPNRYVLSVSGKSTVVDKGALITEAAYANHLTDYMLKQSAGKAARLGIVVAGKTGTPERIWKSERINDGWYVFFVPKANGKGHIVTCVRLESAKGSSEAVRLAGQYVIPVLLQRGYIKSFDKPKASPLPGKPVAATKLQVSDSATQLETDTIGQP